MPHHTQLELAKPIGVETAKSILVVAAWFGLVTGLVEGPAFLILQQLHWLNFNMALTGVWLPIIWISPLFDFMLFSAIGLFVTTLLGVLPRLLAIRLAVFVFAFLMVFDWLSLSGRLGGWGVFWLAAGVGVVLARRLRTDQGGLLSFWRRTLPWATGIAALAFLAIQGGGLIQERLATAQLPTAAPGSPNILVIVVDTLRADHLSSYGYARPTSPNVDELARQGVLFENAIATSSWTLPSHTSFLTGRYVFEHGAFLRPYDGRYPTLAQVLQTRGYRTAAFSANIIFFTRGWGLGRGFMHFEDYFESLLDAAVRPFYGLKVGRRVLLHLGYEDLPGRKRANDINRAALRWIRSDRRPFFVVVNYLDVHEPYLPPQPYRSRFSNVERPGGIVNGLVWRTGQFKPPLSPAQIQSEKDAYDGSIAYVDNSIGQLLSDLKARGLADNLLTVVLSDHGEEFQEHGWMSHGNNVYRDVIHVPLVFWWPAHLPEASRVSQPVSLAWLPATLMDLLGVKNQSVFPGPSLAQLWKEPATSVDWPNPLSELKRIDQKDETNSIMSSLVSSHWHFITSPKQGPELYDWINDPRESNNLAETPDGQKMVREFLNGLQTVMAKR